MIRVLHVLGRLNRGGAETMLMNIYRNIDKTKIQFDFVKHTNEKCAYDDEIISMGGRIYTVPQYKLYNHLKYKKEWKKLLLEHDEWKIVHSHIRSTASIILKIAKKQEKRTISHSHSTSNGNGLKSILKKIFQLRIPQYSDYLVACSKDAAKWLYGRKYLQSEKCIILKNSIDIKKFYFNIENREKIRKKYNIKNNEILIGHVGRFVEVKNHKFLVDLFEKIMLSDNNYKLMLIGEGILKSKIEEKILNKKIEKNIIFIDSISNINEFYSAFDVLTLPSLYEGLGMVLIEGQFAGVKCFASENVPIDAKISNNIEFLKLDIELWKEKILEINDFLNRNVILLDEAKKYDITKNVKFLEDFYINIIQKKV